MILHQYLSGRAVGENDLGKVGSSQTQEQQHLLEAQINPATVRIKRDGELAPLLLTINT